MNNKIRFFSVLMVFVFLVFNSCVFAIEGNENIEVFFRNIKVFVDKEELQLENEPFIYKNRTYIPLGAVSEAMNKEVEWNPKKNSISIFSYMDFEECNPLKGERFVYGEILGIDKEKRTIHLYQHIDDNSVDEEPYMKISKDVIIILQRNDKKINLDFEDIKIGDTVGMVVASNNEIRGIIVEG